MYSPHLNDMRSRLETALEFSAARPAQDCCVDSPLVLLGSGSVYAQPFIAYALAGLKVVACVDNLRRGQRQGKLVVQGDDALPELIQKHPQALGVLCCQSDGAVGHFSQKWRGTGRPLVNMFEVMRAHGHDGGQDYYLHFQQPDVLKHIYEECWPRFTDEESQRSFLSVLLFRATLAQHWLEAIRLPYDDMYFFTSGLTVSDDEVFVDVGSFDGDSLTQFLRRVGPGYRHIHAMEPDPLNFEQLKRNFGHLPRSTLHDCGLWHQSTQVSIQLNGLGSYLDARPGAVTVRVQALDDMNLGPISFLKMDIEGAEVPALEGARQTILRDKPKLAIAAYHKADDLPCLIRAISAIRDDYRFTMRHHSPFFRDTILMAE